jgi:hypothetical protein
MIPCSALFLRFAPLESGSEMTTDVLLRLKTSWLRGNLRSSVALPDGGVHVPGA